jgi:hypothetical protein
MRNLFRTLIVSAILLGSIVPCLAQPKQESVVLVTLEGVSLDQLVRWRIPEFMDLVRAGGIGLMNDRAVGSLCFANNAATISAGTRALGLRPDLEKTTIDETSLAFNASERVGQDLAGSILSRNCGTPAPSGSVVHIGAASIRTLNMDQYYTVLPGKLGSQLRHAGVDTYAFGNSDHDGIPSRDASAIAMDESGLLSGGDVSARTFLKDPSRPSGVKTNFDFILDRIRHLDSPKSFTVVEAGDGGRINAVEPYLSPERDELFKRLAAMECCRFAKELDDELKSNSERHLVILAVTSPDSNSALDGDLLTPILMVGTGVHQGALTSQTTRRKGIVANYDITPTVLGFFDVKPDPSMMGRPLLVQPQKSALSRLQAAYTRIVATDMGRPPLMKGYIYLLSLVVIASVVLLLPVVRRRDERILRSLRPVIVGILLVPLSLLAAPGFGLFGAIPTAAFTLLTAFPVGWILSRRVCDMRLLLAIVGVATAVTVSVDLVLGARLLEQSVLSYSVIAGARYYGIGNEYSGILLGSVLLGAFSLLDRAGDRVRYPLLWLGLIYVVVFVLLGSPQFGTKFGGMIATIAGFSVAIVKMRGGKLMSKRFLMAGIGGVVLLAVVIALNMALAPSRQTHIGHIFSQAQAGGPSVIIETALRKWAMNFKLMRYSTWAISLISMTLALIVLFSKLIGAGKLLAGHKHMSAGFSGILAVAIVAFLTNDAGVVMASTTLIFFAFPLVLLSERY